MLAARASTMVHWQELWRHRPELVFAEAMIAAIAIREELRMQYVCLFYFDPSVVLNNSAESSSVLAAVASYDEQLRASGNRVTSRVLTSPDDAVTVEVREGNMSATDGSFLENKEVLGGLALVEARNLNEAVTLAAAFPLAKLGWVEVRAVVDSLPDSRAEAGA